MTEPFRTPDWVKHAIFYQIFPDRFAVSERVEKPGKLESWDEPPTRNGFKGGDLLGVVEHLDYLTDLGITAIYLNPIFQSASNHRYHTHDYYQVDPILGGNDAFKVLLQQAHRRGIRVVLDGVFNHASRGFFPFNHILETGEQSPYLKWFRIHRFPLNAYHGKPNYDAWWSLAPLPEFNTDNPKVREFLYGVARHWIEQGIDGWRLDVPFEILTKSFWETFRRVVKSDNPEAYLVGEVPEEAQQWLKGDRFDGVMNYQFTHACVRFFAGETMDREVGEGMMGLPDPKPSNGRTFLRRAEELLTIYPAEAVLAQLNLLSSHDMPRFLAIAGGDVNSYKLATLFQMTYPGAPCIYYGDEIGMRGGRARSPEDSRAGFPWDRSRWNLSLRSDIERYIRIRKKYKALRTGAFIPLYAEGYVIAYLRRLEGEHLVIVINNGNQPFPLSIPAGEHLPDGTSWSDLLEGGEAGVVDGHLEGSPLPPRSGRIYHPLGREIR